MYSIQSSLISKQVPDKIQLSYLASSDSKFKLAAKTKVGPLIVVIYTGHSYWPALLSLSKIETTFMTGNLGCNSFGFYSMR